jgi:hypothetical protein
VLFENKEIEEVGATAEPLDEDKIEDSAKVVVEMVAEVVD